MCLKIACMVLLAVLSNPRTEQARGLLHCLVEKADLVVAGEIVNRPLPFSSEEGVVNYGFRLKVTEVLKGEAKKDEELRTVVVRFEREAEDRLPFDKGTKCILFLNRL